MLIHLDSFGLALSMGYISKLVLHNCLLNYPFLEAVHINCGLFCNKLVVRTLGHYY